MTAVKALIQQVGGPSVRLTYNPERITISHTLVMKELSGQKGESLNVDEAVRRLGIHTIRIESVVFFGADTQKDCNQLLTWSNAVSRPAVGTDPPEAVPVDLEFVWGEKIFYDVHMETVVVAYTKFAGATGMPVRATANLTMHQYVRVKPPANPTSGGPPDRRAHVLDSSECLPSLAATHYGRPSAWRDLARANGIDDPLRVRPGHAVYLPRPDEFGAAPGGRR